MALLPQGIGRHLTKRAVLSNGLTDLLRSHKLGLGRERRESGCMAALAEGLWKECLGALWCLQSH